MRGESLVKEVIEGRMKGKRVRGKPRIMMLDYIKADMIYEKIKRRAMDRECWRKKIVFISFLPINILFKTYSETFHIPSILFL